jgi:hypothetical protein
MLLRIAVDFVEYVWVSEKGSQAGISTKQNSPATVFGFGIIGGIGVTENSAAEGYKLPCTRLTVGHGESFGEAGHKAELKMGHQGRPADGIW